MTKPIVPATGYILPVYDQLLNPRKGNDYYTPGNNEQVCYIVRRGEAKLLKAFTSYGKITGWKLGASAPVVSDQTRRDLGQHTIVGIIDADGTMTGDVPNNQLQHGVFK